MVKGVYGKARTSTNPRAKYNRGETRRRYYVKYRYGVEWDDYQAQIREGCKICGDLNPAAWHLDHDETCCPASQTRLCGDCTRGVLCPLCNTLLGHAKESVAILKSAISYLEAWNDRKRIDRPASELSHA